MSHASNNKVPVPLRARLIGTRWLFDALIIGFVALLAMSFAVGFVDSGRNQVALDENHRLTRDIGILQQALLDAETGVRSFILTEHSEYLESYFSALGVLDARSPFLLPHIDTYAAGLADSSSERYAVSQRISDLRRIWTDAVLLTQNHAAAAARTLVQDRQQKHLMDELRALINVYIAHQIENAGYADSRLAFGRRVLVGVALSGALISLVALIFAVYRRLRETTRSEAATAVSEQATQRVEQLFGMTSMLQSATDREDADEVLRATATRLLPGFSGGLYIFNSSQDRLDLSITWGLDDATPPLDHIKPSSCWAMKRDKPQLNIPGDGALRCNHHPAAAAAALEIPMAAHGQVFGLLVIGIGQPDAVAALKNIQPIAAALADGMSLALSSITLREQLRNQALRDPLTGLYNRRFLEEALHRLGLDAQRRKSSLAAIMIDLDHFKLLNDQYGHATGDTVLRDVSTAITSALRATDIVCRYGGEELAVLLPDCPIEMAMAKAELLRASIADLAPGPRGATVTASLGVAAIPDTTNMTASLLASADAALYEAKQTGRNRVVQATSRAPLSVRNDGAHLLEIVAI